MLALHGALCIGSSTLSECLRAIVANAPQIDPHLMKHVCHDDPRCMYTRHSCSVTASSSEPWSSNDSMAASSLYSTSTRQSPEVPSAWGRMQGAQEHTWLKLSACCNTRSCTLQSQAQMRVHTVALGELSRRCWGAATPRTPPCVQNSTRGSAAEPPPMASLTSNSTCTRQLYRLSSQSNIAL